jgi:uncharacterized protein involved in copper resistance
MINGGILVGARVAGHDRKLSDRFLPYVGVWRTRIFSEPYGGRRNRGKTPPAARWHAAVCRYTGWGG